VRLAAIALGCVLATGCAYFNGVYNAKEEQRNGDHEVNAGRDGSSHYSLTAEKAETVLARYPNSRWRGDALYLAGRGAALSGHCAQGEPRLTEYLALAGQPADRRDRATVALGSCLVQRARYADARALLEPLTTSRDREVSLAASRWAARASIALGDNAAAMRYLSGINQADAQWELIAASLARMEYARTDSLLAARAQRSDFRDALLPALGELFAAGYHDRVEAIVQTYLLSGRTSASEKLRLRMLVSQLEMDAGLDSLAEAHLVAAQRLHVDTVAEHEAAARLLLLQLRAADSVPQMDSAIVRAERTAGGTAIYRQVSDNMLLVDMLRKKVDGIGASVFLAAEVARDSLHAPRAARRLFRQVTADWPTSLFASKALLAAAVLAPDSAEAYARELRTHFPQSPFTTLADGGDVSNDPLYARADEILRTTWTSVIKEFGEELTRRHPPPGIGGQPAALPPSGP
jgi:hypothetical protein